MRRLIEAEDVRAELAGVPTRPLAAVGGTGREARVALAADLLVAVVLGGKHLERGLDDTATETEDQVQGALLLDVVVGEGSAVLELLAGEDQSLLIRRDALLVLDLGLDIVDGVGRLHLEGDGLARQGLHEAVARERFFVSRCCSNILFAGYYIAIISHSFISSPSFFSRISMNFSRIIAGVEYVFALDYKSNFGTREENGRKGRGGEERLTSAL